MAGELQILGTRRRSTTEAPRAWSPPRFARRDHPGLFLSSLSVSVVRTCANSLPRPAQGPECAKQTQFTPFWAENEGVDEKQSQSAADAGPVYRSRLRQTNPICIGRRPGVPKAVVSNEPNLPADGTHRRGTEDTEMHVTTYEKMSCASFPAPSLVPWWTTGPVRRPEGTWGQRCQTNPIHRLGPRRPAALICEWETGIIGQDGRRHYRVCFHLPTKGVTKQSIRTDRSSAGKKEEAPCGGAVSRRAGANFVRNRGRKWPWGDDESQIVP